MQIHFLYLIPAIALLWYPRQKLRFRNSLFPHQKNKFTDPRDMREPGDVALRPGEEFRKFRNLIDLLRAMAGSYGVMVFGLTCESLEPSDTQMWILLIQASIMILAVALQTVRFEGRITLHAPMFFLTGLATGISGLESAAFGSAGAWVINALLPTPAAFLVAQGVLVALFSAFFHGPTDPVVFLSGGLTLLPPFIGFMLRRSLTVGAKRIIKGA